MCPIVAQDDKEIECKCGDHLAHSRIPRMNFDVRGVDDKIPGK